jgi:hypothetical protein
MKKKLNKMKNDYKTLYMNSLQLKRKLKNDDFIHFKV